MCARDDFGVEETIRAADGCECPGRWCERPLIGAETQVVFHDHTESAPCTSRCSEVPKVSEQYRSDDGTILSTSSSRLTRLPFPTVNDVVHYQAGDV